ncbi:MAG: HAD family hydrolase, partial [Nevskia sp.]|nr:HAD family hydrolase [Nevskia sp.]
LLAGDSDYLWGQFLIAHGRVDGASYERENRRFYEEYNAGTLDIEEFARFSLAPLVQGDPAEMRALRGRFVQEQIAPVVARGARPLLDEHRARGDLLIITTATNRFITEPIAELLGVPHLLATEPETIDGRFTGRLTGHPNFREGKVLRLRDWLERREIEYRHATCYSDSQNDLPLLEFADSAVAVDPDPILRAEAARRGWRIISLRE